MSRMDLTQRTRWVVNRRAGCRGAALMEVLLALALFVAAAAVVTTALNASLSSLERQRLAVHAMNLTASIMAEIQLGIRPLAADARRPLPAPFEAWTSEVVVVATETGGLESAPAGQVEVILRHENPLLVQRLAQRVGRVGTASTESPALTQ